MENLRLDAWRMWKLRDFIEAGHYRNDGPLVEALDAIDDLCSIASVDNIDELRNMLIERQSLGGHHAVSHPEATTSEPGDTG